VQNPYAPPADPSPEPDDDDDRPRARGRGATSDFLPERRPVILLICLTIMSLGIYPIVWFFRRRPFLDSFDVHAKLGTGLPTMLAAANILTLLLTVVETMAAGKPDDPIHAVSKVTSLAASVVGIMCSFRVRSILEAEFAESGRPLPISGVWTFFFSIFYLQYKMNQAGDYPDTRRRRRKKKKRKKVVDPERDASDATD
jgi:hypothetical protein